MPSIHLRQRCKNSNSTTLTWSQEKLSLKLIAQWWAIKTLKRTYHHLIRTPERFLMSKLVIELCHWEIKMSTLLWPKERELVRWKLNHKWKSRMSRLTALNLVNEVHSSLLFRNAKTTSNNNWEENNKKTMKTNISKLALALDLDCQVPTKGILRFHLRKIHSSLHLFH